MRIFPEIFWGVCFVLIFFWGLARGPSELWASPEAPHLLPFKPGLGLGLLGAFLRGALWGLL